MPDGQHVAHQDNVTVDAAVNLVCISTSYCTAGKRKQMRSCGRALGCALSASMPTRWNGSLLAR